MAAIPAVEVEVAYGTLAAGVQVFVARKQDEFLTEGPYERLDLHHEDPIDDETEAVIRLWLSEADCERYCAIWRELLDIGPQNKLVCVQRVSLKELWHYLAPIVSNSYADYQVPPRLDLSRFGSDGDPVVVDTLFTEREEMN